jgi:hypothetical protein
LLSGGKTETSRVPVLLIDQDNSAISRGLSAQLTSDKNLDVTPSTFDEARTAVRLLFGVVAVTRFRWEADA